ncbi:MAG: hypothetical protein WA383_18325 [Terriglobales bacterium]
MGKKFVLVACLATAICASVSQATAHTQSITIGKFTYVGTGPQTNSDGTVSEVSSYKVRLDTTNITIEPISFSNLILLVKGTEQGSGAITTGLGCGLPPYEAPCDLRFEGGPRSAGFSLAPCAKLNKEQELTQTCISIAVQLVSSTGKNFSFPLANGNKFCAYGISNVFLLAKPGQAALEPRCDAQGFCKGASVPIILHAAPAKSCSQ